MCNIHKICDCSGGRYQSRTEYDTEKKPNIFTTNPLKKRLACFCSKIFAYIKFLEKQPGKVILATLWLLQEDQKLETSLGNTARWEEPWLTGWDWEVGHNDIVGMGGSMTGAC